MSVDSTKKVPENNTFNSTGGSSTPQTKYESLKAGVGNVGNSIGSALASASEWETVKTVRGSTFWSYVTWPFSSLGSLISGLWDRFSKAYWGGPTPVTAKVTIEFPGWFGRTSTQDVSTETALSKGWLTIEQGVAKNYFTREDAKINGWVPVTIPGKYYGNSTMMLKEAVERGHMTIEQAITDNHITESQASSADWVKKKEPTK